MDEKQFSYPLKSGIAMFNEHGFLKPSGYQELYMQGVEPHLKNIEMDEPRLIREFGAAWVLIAMTVEPRRPIRPDDSLTMRTWNSTDRRLLFRREFELLDAAGEQVLVGESFSTLLMLETRRVCMDRELLERFRLPAGERLLEAPDRIRLKTPETEPVEHITARPSWTDGVGHVNNFRYGEMTYDALTDAQRGQMEKLRRMELFFNAETHAGDALALYRLEDDEAVTVAVCQEGEPRPAFAARLLF